MRTRPPKVRLSLSAKKEQRRLKNKIRREARKRGDLPSKSSSSITLAETPHLERQLWSGISSRAAAMKVINDNRHRPFWLSIPKKGTSPPLSGYFPCSMFSSGGRWYFGFLFREHRDDLFKKWPHARKELTNVGEKF